ncbi:MAG TPA: sigma-54 dependent transcriptional regulator [Bryobacteraceae bacterium]|nr:sigma-54 dependent transcriptional regulator [Bryobacteraceae bacterium]
MPRADEIPPPMVMANSRSEWNQSTITPSTPTHQPTLDRPALCLSDEIVGTSVQIQSIKRCIDRVAPCDATVLITGETGTGKELVAHRLHRMSNRRNGPLISINCAAIPDSLIESELFGFEKGTFTGAASRQEGRLLQANGGTLFLDEIGDLSASAQAKILRVLEQREVQPLGSRTTRIMDARIVAATNRNLEQLATTDSFRSDLFFRLSVINVHIPPLRERPEDIPPIAVHILRQMAIQYAHPFVSLTAGAQAYLQQLPWRGNVRELRNFLERALLFSNSEQITEHDVGEMYHSTTNWQGGTVSSLAADFESDIQTGRRTARTSSRSRKVASSQCSELTELRNALEQTKWNKTKTAEVLQWSRMTIYRKIVQYDLHPPEQ